MNGWWPSECPHCRTGEEKDPYLFWNVTKEGLASVASACGGSALSKTDDLISRRKTATKRISIQNTVPRRDTAGNIMDAHDGKLIMVNGVYYLCTVLTLSRSDRLERSFSQKRQRFRRHDISLLRRQCAVSIQCDVLLLLQPRPRELDAAQRRHPSLLGQAEPPWLR